MNWIGHLILFIGIAVITLGLAIVGKVPSFSMDELQPASGMVVSTETVEQPLHAGIMSHQLQVKVMGFEQPFYLESTSPELDVVPLTCKLGDQVEFSYYIENDQQFMADLSVNGELLREGNAFYLEMLFFKVFIVTFLVMWFIGSAVLLFFVGRKKKRPQTGQLKGATYKASGRINLRRLAYWSPALFVIACLVGLLMSHARLNGLYLCFMMPLALSLLGGIGLANVLKRMHCRSFFFGYLLVAGTLLLAIYSGFFFTMRQDAAYTGERTISEVPTYFMYCMKTESISSFPARVIKGEEPEPFANWSLMGLEFFFVFFIPFSFVRETTRRPYCESCKQWMGDQTVGLAYQHGRHVLDFLNKADVTHLQQCTKQALLQNKKADVLILYHCAACANQQEKTPTAYLSLRQCEKVFTPLPMVGQGQNICHNLLLSESQTQGFFTWLGGRAGQLDQLRGAKPNLAIDHKISTADPGFTQSGFAMTTPSYAHPAYNSVKIEPVPVAFRGKILNRKNIIKRNLLMWSGILPCLCLTLFGGGFMVLLEQMGVLAQWGKEVELMMVIPFVGLLVCLILFQLFGAKKVAWNFYRKLIFREFSKRDTGGDCIHRPGTRLVEYAPREKWRNVWETAADIGFLLIDREAGMVIFEGDHERIEIPRHALRKVEIEAYNPSPNSKLQVKLVILDIDTPEGLVEMPILADALCPEFLKDKGRVDATILRDDLRAFMMH